MERRTACAGRAAALQRIKEEMQQRLHELERMEGMVLALNGARKLPAEARAKIDEDRMAWHAEFAAWERDLDRRLHSLGVDPR